MSYTNKGVFGVQPHPASSVLCVISPKHVKSLLVVLALVAIVLVMFLVAVIKADIHQWLAKDSKSQANEDGHIKVEKIWVNPGDYIQVSSRLMSFKINKDKREGRVLAKKLENKVRAKLELNRKEIASLKYAHQQKLQTLYHERDEIKTAIIANKYYNNALGARDMNNADLSSHIPLLNERLRDVSIAIRDEPLIFKEQLRILLWYKSDLGYQLENLELHNSYTLIADSEGFIEKIHLSTSNLLNENTMLISMTMTNDSASELEQKTGADVSGSLKQVFLLEPKIKAFEHLVDARLKKAAFKYLHY